jgi:hypothetical protein
MTVQELIENLEKMPFDAKVCMASKLIEVDDFTVELSDDGWVVLEGD